LGISLKRERFRLTHNQHQQGLFATEARRFCEPISEEIYQRLCSIVSEAQLGEGERVLDVGTGTGVLIPLIQSYEVGFIMGCDLSPVMLGLARQHCPDVPFWCGDIIEFPVSKGPFDAVFINAVFGNLWDQQQSLGKINELLKPAGRICISHPLGSGFVEELHRTDPRRTPHTLPDRARLLEMTNELPLQLIGYQDNQDLYIALLRKSRRQ